MPILNYTTQIDAAKSIQEINTILAAHGARSILTEYGESGTVEAVSFLIRVNGSDVGFKLPADWRPILTILEKNRKVPRRLVNQSQAVRVSWRIIKDWIEAQMALVETKMVQLDQVFFPYAQTPDGRTVYELVKERGYLQLKAGE